MLCWAAESGAESCWSRCRRTLLKVSIKDTAQKEEPSGWARWVTQKRKAYFGARNFRAFRCSGTGILKELHERLLFNYDADLGFLHF